MIWLDLVRGCDSDHSGLFQYTPAPIRINRFFYVDKASQTGYMFMKKSTMLSTTSEYALRALTRLAAAPDGESMLGRDLAEQAGIPANYLSKIMWTLGNAGLIDATRGNHGGY